MNYLTEMVLVEALIKNGATVNASNTAGATPLRFAAQQGKYDIVLILIQAGAKLSFMDCLTSKDIKLRLLRTKLSQLRAVRYLRDWAQGWLQRIALPG